MNLFSKTTIAACLLAAVALLPAACTNNTDGAYAALKPFHWLQGAWKSTSTAGTFVEMWTLQDDSTLHCLSFYVADGDTLPSETIELRQRNGKIFYVPTVFNQNKGLPVSFALHHANDSGFVFENPKHDFPQRIAYRIIAEDTMQTQVSLLSDTDAISMQMVRVNN